MRDAIRRSAVLGALILSPASAFAQSSRDPGRAIVVSGGVTALPDALSTQCGSRTNGGGGGGPEGGVALLLRGRGSLIFQADTRIAMQMLLNCYLIGVPVDTVFASSSRRDPFATSTLRVGVETPAGLPLVRLTAGAGVVWGGRPLPLTVLAAGWSTRGQRMRFLIEAERIQTRVAAQEVRHDWTNSQSSVSRAIVLHPVAHTFRIGVEWPLGSP